MRLIDIDELRGCAIIRPLSHKDMGHILSCSNILIHTEIPTAYDVKHDKEIRSKTIEEFMEQIERKLLEVHPDEMRYTHTSCGIVNICRDIAEEMKAYEED